MQEANITTTERIGTDRPIWSGLFHFLVRADCDLDYLRGARGGYVNAIAVASNAAEFDSRVIRAFSDRKLVYESADEIENISSRYSAGTLSEEWIELCRSAIENGDVAFTAFDLYDNDE